MYVHGVQPPHAVFFAISTLHEVYTAFFYTAQLSPQGFATQCGDRCETKQFYSLIALHTVKRVLKSGSEIARFGFGQSCEYIYCRTAIPIYFGPCREVSLSILSTLLTSSDGLPRLLCAQALLSPLPLSCFLRLSLAPCVCIHG